MTLRVRRAPSARTTRSARDASGVLAVGAAVGFLLIAAGDPTPGSVLTLGAGTLAYIIATFGAKTV